MKIKKEYTYNPKKYQNGAQLPPMMPTPPTPATISQAPGFLDNLVSDVRSIVKYPFQSARTFLQQGEIPYNFDKGVEAGQVPSQPMDFAASMVNVPSALIKGTESLMDGDAGKSAMNFASVLPFVRPLKAVGISPTTAKAVSKGVNKSLKANTSYQGGGSILNNKKLEKLYPDLPTYDQFAEQYNIKLPDTAFFGYGPNKEFMVSDEVLKARVAKRLDEDGNFTGTIPYLPQNFDIKNIIRFPSKKKGKPDLEVYFEKYNKNELQGGGMLMSREQIAAEMERINEARAAEQERLAQFQQNIQGQLPNYATAEERNADPKNQKSIDSTQVIGNTYGYLNSLAEQNKNSYGCTSYGCGMMREAGATLPGDVQMPGSDRVYSAGSKLPIFAGNAMMNSMIEQDPAAMGFEVINPQSYEDLQPGDRIVSNYSTGGPEGGQHTQIFSGQYDDQGRPIIMENMGGSFRKGISSRGVDYNFADPESGYRVTRYTGDMQNLNNELARYQEMLDTGRFRPTAVSTLTGEGIQPVLSASTEMQTTPLQGVGMGKGGSVSWMFGGKKYSGTLIPSMETDKARFARTHNGKIKTLPKKKMAPGGTTQGTADEAEKGMGFMGANTGFGKAMSKIPFAQLGSLGAGLYNASLPSDPTEISEGEAGTAGAIGMAGQGASMGMALGPIGGIVGGVLGAIGGGLLGKSQHKKLLAKLKRQKEEALNNRLAAMSAQDQVNAASVLSQYPTEGVDNYSYYAEDGGMMKAPDYTVEGGELMMGPANNPPQTDENGEVRKIGPNMFKFVGDTHDAPSGGIGVKGGNTGFGSQTNQALDAGFVFSDRLKTNVDDYLKYI